MNSFLVFFASFAALACPQLTGQYMDCSPSSSGMKVESINQRIQDGVTIFTINGREFMADGKVQIEEDGQDPDIKVLIEYLVQCRSNKELAWSLKSYINGQLVHQFSRSFKKIQNELTVETKGSGKKETVTCREQ